MKQADTDIIALLREITAGSSGSESDPLALKIGNNLSDLNNAGTARTNLGLVIGTNVQAYDADLTTWAAITPGTGVGTALAVNVGSAGAFVAFDGALGTPSSGVATNLTGTASGLTAGNVTTNANLTGHVISTGNAAVLGSFTLAQLNAAVSDADVARTDAANTFTGVQTMTSPSFAGTIVGTPTWTSAQAITLSTAAQPSVTSLGNLTSLAVTGTVTAGGQLSLAAGVNKNRINMTGSEQNLLINSNSGSLYLNFDVTDPIIFGTAGTPVKNIRHGVSGAMVAGVVTVTDAGNTASSKYFFTVKTLGTVAIPSTYYVSARSTSTSFTVTASVLTDTSTLDWFCIEP